MRFGGLEVLVEAVRRIRQHRDGAVLGRGESGVVGRFAGLLVRAVRVEVQPGRQAAGRDQQHRKYADPDAGPGAPASGRRRGLGGVLDVCGLGIIDFFGVDFFGDVGLGELLCGIRLGELSVAGFV